MKRNQLRKEQDFLQHVLVREHHYKLGVPYVTRNHEQLNVEHGGAEGIPYASLWNEDAVWFFYMLSGNYLVETMSMIGLLLISLISPIWSHRKS